MKFKIFALILAVVIMMFNVNIAAEDAMSLSVSYSPETASITLSGVAYGRVSVIITDFGIESSITDDDVLYSNLFRALGGFSYEIKLGDDFESGKYSVILTSASGKKTDTFSHMNLGASGDVLELLKETESVEEFISIIESGDNAKTLGIDKNDTYYEANSDYAYKMLYNLSKDYTDPVKFNESFYKFYAISVIKDGTKEEILAVSDKYSDKLSIDYEKLLKDERLTDKAFSKLFELLSKIDYLGEFTNRKNTDFALLLEESKYVSALSGADNWQEIKAAVTEGFKDFFDVSANEKYASLMDENGVYSEMMNYSYTKYEDITAGFEKAATVVWEKENASINTGGRPSSGGAGGGGGKANTPVQIPSDIEETFPTDNKLSFTDFPEEHWSYSAVLSLSKQGFISGYEDNTFRPEKNITRAEFTKIIFGVYEKIVEEKTADNAATFSDVNENDWFYPFVTSAASTGLIKGSDGKFTPYDNISRQDAALIIYRVLSKITTVSGNKVFPDRSEISEYAREAVSALGAMGVVKGDGNGFGPKQMLTRAQASQLIYNALEFVK